MPERLYWVTLATKLVDGDDRQFRMVFASELPTVAAIAEEIRQFGVVSGYRLRIEDDGQGGRRVREREELMFGAAMVRTIQVYAHPVAGL